MRNYPRVWFANIVALLEKRAYHTYTVLLFALFVASVRLFTEWAVGGAYPGQLLSAFLVSAGFYWLSFFAVTTVLSITVNQPWRRSINVILVGIFLGIFPPLIDVVAHGKGFEYGYVWQFPEQWRWTIYNAEHKITFGEGTVLWAVILLTTAYVWHKTRQIARTAGALALAYGSVVLTFSLVATTTWEICKAFGWPIDHRVAVMALLQYATACLLYLHLQPRLLANVAAGMPYALLLGSLYLLGAAATAPFTVTIAAYGFILLVSLLGVRMAGGGSGDAEPDAEDRRFFFITNVFVLLCVAAAHSTAVMPLLVLLFAAHRRRVGMPMFAALAVATFALGVIAGMESEAYGAPRWWIRYVPRPQQPGTALNPFGAAALGVMLLIAGGFALAQWFTERRRGARSLTGLAPAAALAAAAIPAGLAVAGVIGWMYPPLGIVAAVSIWLALHKRVAPPAAPAMAASLAAYVLFLVFALRYPLT